MPEFDTTPKLLKARSFVVRCGCCHRWIARVPSFFGDPFDMDQCEKCGCTSFTTHEGRPYGPKSNSWQWVLDMWSDLWSFTDPDQVDTVITDPPMSQIKRHFNR